MNLYQLLKINNGKYLVGGFQQSDHKDIIKPNLTITNKEVGEAAFKERSTSLDSMLNVQ